MKIPKIIHQVWIGDKPAPKRWMQTWQEHHPDWEYVLWDNEMVRGMVIPNGWLCAAAPQFDFYWKQKRWHGCADILRYAILYYFGGFMPCADEECLRPTDELFDNDGELFAVVNDCGKFNDPVDLTFKDANLTPLYASMRFNPFPLELLNEISKVERPGKPWIYTGNALMKRMILLAKPDITVWPSFYFVPEYKDGTRYQGEFKPYGEQHWGTTRQNYSLGI